MDTFEALLSECRNALERFVYYRMPVKSDADDILQEVYLTAYRKLDTLKEPSNFKAWILCIARNQCNDYFRAKAKILEIPLEDMAETKLCQNRYGIAETSTVRETLDTLYDKEKQILYLYYFRELSQTEIARRLGIPLGTVKSRLYTAKASFKAKYPYAPKRTKGDFMMKKLPERMPEYTILPSDQAMFSVQWEELMGWFLVPKLGEKLSWGMYDMPSRKCSHVYEMEVTGKAEIHGIEGVELQASEAEYSSKKEAIHRTFVAQLTDTHCRYLASMRTENGVRKYITFLDEADFMPNWGFGENNCGNEVHISSKNEIVRNGSEISCMNQPFLLDMVGRYDLTILGRTYDTVCVMDIETYNSGVVSEQYLDANGRTILWRRFNRDDWAIERYKQKWSEQLPENERLTVNGETYVQWYDCITDYIL